MVLSVPDPKSVASLLDHVERVFLGASKEKMGWVNAQRHIASVQDSHPVGDGSVVKNPTGSVGVARVAGGNHEFAVSACGAGPNPAARFRDRFPFGGETLHRRAALIALVTH
jgi:hypothetical protein